MKLASIREFRSEISEYGKAGQLVVITNHGKMIGCFLPLDQVQEVPLELKREFVAWLGKEIASSLAEKKVSEKKVLDDFRTFKKNRR